VRAIVDGMLDRTVSILMDRRDVLERAARRLLEKETLEEHELRQLTGPSGSPLPQAAE
jgi:cell division protease FtsH